MDQQKIINELLELGGSVEGMQQRIQKLLRELDTPVSNPRKRINLKQIRVAEINDYRATRKFKNRK